MVDSKAGRAASCVLLANAPTQLEVFLTSLRTKFDLSYR